MSDACITSEIRTRADGAHIAWITIDNPGKINILDSRLCTELRDAANEASDHPELRAIVLTGAGDRAFIGGADIREMATLDPDNATAFITGLHEACAAFRFALVPVIARIQGYCLGGGLEVAASCDIRVTANDGVFGMPEVRVGIPSVIEAALLPGLIGWGKTREMLYTGATFDAAEALACGLVEKVVGSDELDAAVEAWLDGICASAPKAVRAQKALIRKWQELSLEAAIQAGVSTFAEAYRSDEPGKLMQDFINRPR
ncbi:MAG: enoyl-CoA hydratase [Geminicoccales bacterium]